jgi:hypothetical protein
MKDNKGIIVEGVNSALKKHVGRELNDIVLTQIKKEMEEIMNKVLKENYIHEKDFPIEYENELGLWKLNSDGKVLFAPRAKKDYICVNIKIERNEK